ncbi:2-hydroxyacyl-CoA dehydratase family protein, partial [bacterium]|nr:2-hydroxyacyl-CoA dehydratase family protein [bacterium]
MKAFYEAATRIQNQPILDWKKQGKKIVGYTCSYTPGEIFHAADILPVRLRGIETEGMEIGDTYYGPFVCSFPKCILQLAGKGLFSFLDGAIITPGCDAMRRLDECWRKAGEDYEGIVPPYFYYFDVPHKTEVHGMNWFIQEIRNLITSLETHFGVKITEEKLKASIREYNKGRRLLSEIEDLRAEKDGIVSGSDAFAATVAGTVIPREEYTRQLEEWLVTLKEGNKPPNGKKRLMLLGSISDDIDLVQLIEKENDAVVVAENLCFGVRFEGDEVSAEGDPVEALARHYLGKSVCPRMFGKYKERLGTLKEK